MERIIQQFLLYYKNITLYVNDKVIKWFCTFWTGSEPITKEPHNTYDEAPITKFGSDTCSGSTLEEARQVITVQCIKENFRYRQQ